MMAGVDAANVVTSPLRVSVPVPVFMFPPLIETGPIVSLKPLRSSRPVHVKVTGEVSDIWLASASRTTADSLEPMPSPITRLPTIAFPFGAARYIVPELTVVGRCSYWGCYRGGRTWLFRSW